jgi:hypothetical protein
VVSNAHLIVEITVFATQYWVFGEELIATWVENPYWRYFCGEKYLRHEARVDPSVLTRWRSGLVSGCARTATGLRPDWGVRQGAMPMPDNTGA